MNPAFLIAIIQAGAQELFSLYTYAKQRHGDAIPDWDTIIKGNTDLQAKIDAEKK